MPVKGPEVAGTPNLFSVKLGNGAKTTSNPMKYHMNGGRNAHLSSYFKVEGYHGTCFDP